MEDIQYYLHGDLEAQNTPRNTNTHVLPENRLLWHSCKWSRKCITLSSLFTIIACLSLVWYIHYWDQKMTAGWECIFTTNISGQIIGEIQIQTSSNLYSSCCFSWYGLSWRVYWLLFTGLHMAGLWRWHIRYGKMEGSRGSFLLVWWYYGYLVWFFVELLLLYWCAWRFLPDESWKEFYVN